MPKTRKPKTPVVGQYKNMRPMETNSKLWQFDVLTKTQGWVTMTNVGVSNESDRKTFAQKTADRWIKL